MQNKSLPPFDMAISHKERYRYPVRDDRGTVLRYTATITKLATRYYCVNKLCLLKRHSYFWIGVLTVEDAMLASLEQCHLNYLNEQLGYMPNNLINNN